MLVVLVQPPPREGYPNFEGPSLSLSNLAAFLETNGHKVLIKDFFVEQYLEKNFLKYITSLKPDLIGITSFTRNYTQTRRLLKTLKKDCSECPVVMGGPHPTALPEDVLKDGADYVIRGEGELTILELLDSIMGTREPCTIHGLSFKEKTDFVHNPNRFPINDIKHLPLPAYHLFPMARYKQRMFVTNYSPKAIIISTSRGCPYRCIFCQRNLLGLKFRTRSLEQTFSEIELLYKNYGYRYFVFADECFGLNQKYLLEFLDRMEDFRKRMTVFWCCQRRVDAPSSESMFKMMRRTGCLYISFGIETGSLYSNRMLKKNINFKRIVPTLFKVRNAGIPLVVSSFIIGFPWESREIIEETISFASSLPLTHLTFNIATPLPGTELWDYSLKEGLINKDIIYNHPLDFLRPVFATDKFSVEYLKKAVVRVHIKFFLKKILYEIVHWYRLFGWHFYMKSWRIALVLTFPLISRYIVSHGSLGALLRRVNKAMARSRKGI